jgi:hypothetical protein
MLEIVERCLAARVFNATPGAPLGDPHRRNPNALFDTSGYLAACADGAAAHINPLDHYHQFGRLEDAATSSGCPDVVCTSRYVMRVTT